MYFYLFFRFSIIYPLEHNLVIDVFVEFTFSFCKILKWHYKNVSSDTYFAILELVS